MNRHLLIIVIHCDYVPINLKLVQLYCYVSLQLFSYFLYCMQYYSWWLLQGAVKITSYKDTLYIVLYMNSIVLSDKPASLKSHPMVPGIKSGKGRGLSFGHRPLSSTPDGGEGLGIQGGTGVVKGGGYRCGGGGGARRAFTLTGGGWDALCYPLVKEDFKLFAVPARHIMASFPSTAKVVHLWLEPPLGFAYISLFKLVISLDFWLYLHFLSFHLFHRPWRRSIYEFNRLCGQIIFYLFFKSSVQYCA